jgi:hypothetical protein
MLSSHLQLNTDKSGSSSRRQHQMLSAPLSFGGSDVTASSVVHKRGVFVDSDLSLRHDVDVITARLRQLRNHPLSRLCSDDIDVDATNPYAA